MSVTSCFCTLLWDETNVLEESPISDCEIVSIFTSVPICVFVPASSLDDLLLLPCVFSTTELAGFFGFTSVITAVMIVSTTSNGCPLTIVIAPTVFTFPSFSVLNSVLLVFVIMEASTLPATESVLVKPDVPAD